MFAWSSCPAPPRARSWSEMLSQEVEISMSCSVFLSSVTGCQLPVPCCSSSASPDSPAWTLLKGVLPQPPASRPATLLFRLDHQLPRLLQSNLRCLSASRGLESLTVQVNINNINISRPLRGPCPSVPYVKIFAEQNFYGRNVYVKNWTNKTFQKNLFTECHIIVSGYTQSQYAEDCRELLIKFHL